MGLAEFIVRGGVIDSSSDDEPWLLRPWDGVENFETVF